MMDSDEKSELVKKGICPSCGNKLAHMEGCVECEFCGWSFCEEA